MSTPKAAPGDRTEDVWRMYLTTGTMPDYVRAPWYESKAMRFIAERLPREPRCPLCLFPFAGFGGKLMKVITGREPSRLNPLLCNDCDVFARKYKGGAEIELTMLFADVRGSTALAEGMSPTAFSELIGRFYRAVTAVLFHGGAMVEKLKGDEVTGLYVPGFTGGRHARVAVRAARRILEVTGHGGPGGAWIPVGVGVHTGTARVGAIEGENGMVEIAALGDAPNTAARLAGEAGPGEAVISEATWQAAGLSELTPQQVFHLRGRSTPIEARVLRLGKPASARR